MKNLLLFTAALVVLAGCSSGEKTTVYDPFDGFDNIPDPVFKTYCVQFDTNGDGVLSRVECDAVTRINVRGTYEADGGVRSLAGIEMFGALEALACDYNALDALDVSENRLLRTLYCVMSGLTELDVSNNTALEVLWCSRNDLASLDVSHNTSLTELLCGRQNENRGELTLTLAEGQQTKWVEQWSEDDENQGVVAGGV